jgi:single-strand DNA-binding protein
MTRRTGQPPVPDGEGPADVPHRNEILLVGRLAADPADRVLPSGDVLTTWRLIVARGPARRPAARPGRSPGVDTLDCVSADPEVRARVSAAPPGEVLRVEGHLRRRFFRTPAGPASRYEVEAVTVRPVTPPAEGEVQPSRPPVSDV